MSAVQILEKFKPYFTVQYFFMDVIVWLSYMLSEFLKMLVDAAESLLTAVYSINDFIFSEPVMSYIETYQPILWILFAFALVVLGYTLIIENDKRPKIFQNLVIAVLVLTALPVIVQQVSTFTFQAADFARTNQSLSESYGNNKVNGKKLKTSDAIIISNTTDLVWCHNKGWENLKTDDNPNGIPKPWNSLTSASQIDVMEKLWAHKAGEEYANVEEFANHLTYKDGKAELKDIEDNIFGGMFIQVYYRYHVDWFPTVITLCFTALALFFASYKVARLIWELAVHQLLAMIFAAGDLTSGQKIREILKSMASIFLTIYMVSVILKFFLIGVQYVQGTDLNGIVKAFIIVFFALAAIDGPNIIERILGVDAGIRSGFHTAFVAMRGVGAAKRAAGAAAHTVAGAAKTTGKAGKAAAKATVAGAETIAGHRGATQSVADAAREKAYEKGIGFSGKMHDFKNRNNPKDAVGPEKFGAKADEKKQMPNTPSLKDILNQNQKSSDSDGTPPTGTVDTGPSEPQKDSASTPPTPSNAASTQQNVMAGIYSQGFKSSEKLPNGTAKQQQVQPNIAAGSIHAPGQNEKLGANGKNQKNIPQPPMMPLETKSGLSPNAKPSAPIPPLSPTAHKELLPNTANQQGISDSVPALNGLPEVGLTPETPSGSQAAPINPAAPIGSSTPSATVSDHVVPPMVSAPSGSVPAGGSSLPAPSSAPTIAQPNRSVSRSAEKRPTRRGTPSATVRFSKQSATTKNFKNPLNAPLRTDFGTPPQSGNSSTQPPVQPRLDRPKNGNRGADQGNKKQ